MHNFPFSFFSKKRKKATSTWYHIFLRLHLLLYNLYTYSLEVRKCHDMLYMWEYYVVPKWNETSGFYILLSGHITIKPFACIRTRNKCLTLVTRHQVFSFLRKIWKIILFILLRHNEVTFFFVNFGEENIFLD